MEDGTEYPAYLHDFVLDGSVKQAQLSLQDIYVLNCVVNADILQTNGDSSDEIYQYLRQGW